MIFDMLAELPIPFGLIALVVTLFLSVNITMAILPSKPLRRGPPRDSYGRFISTKKGKTRSHA